MNNSPKHIAITGGASGIGAAVVQLLVAQGHHVSAFDINPPKDASHWIKTDLSDAGSITAAIAQVDGPFDALINNAGLPPKEGLAETILSVNYFGFQQMLEGLLPKLAGWGVYRQCRLARGGLLER